MAVKLLITSHPSNVRDRACNRIAPTQIKTQGLTHLFYAFANIDPTSFEIAPANPANVSQYEEFTALKRATMETWIAVGGFDFSNAGPTRTTWSEMCSSPSNRARFINSMAAFMNQYGFQGVDLDWEYPATADRGEQTVAIINAKGLVPELIPDAMVKQITWDDQWIGYADDEKFALKLRWADSRCFGGTMLWSIDMDSGSGSGDIPDRPTNTANGANGTNDSKDPGGIGGADGAAGPARQGGVNGGSANGGPADLKNGNVTDVYIDPSIWKEQNPVVMCNPPCQFIFPPYPLQGGGAVITPGSLTTTIDIKLNVAETATVDGILEVKNHFSDTLVMTTISVPPFTATQMEVYGFVVTDSRATDAAITPTPSINIPTFALTQTQVPAFLKRGSSTTSGPIVLYVTPPPFPWVSGDPGNKPPPGPPPGLPPIPVVTFRPGKPGPICKSGCGSPCVLFCSHCGFFGCGGGGCGLLGCGGHGQTDRVDTIKPGDEVEDDEVSAEEDEEEEEEEEEDDECQLVGGSGVANSATDQVVNPGLSGGQPAPKPKPTPSKPAPKPEPTPSEAPVVIAPAPPPPKPKPPLPPEPPSPNPDTEKLKCYDKGSVIARATALNMINDFCGPDYWGGTRIKENRYIRYDGITEKHLVDVIISVQGLNDCAFDIDGPFPDQECGRIIRKIIDKCDQKGTQLKQGGTVTSNCAIWRVDPGIIPVRFKAPAGSRVHDFG
ncbi:MAG: hypothetical protein Q9168_003623 [Polycauliona sp. 1 TL-2023]